MENLIISSIVIGACLISSTIIVIYSIKIKEYFHLIAGSIVMIICAIIEIAVLTEIKNFQTEPTALDVYRGLTELEITSVNGVPKDTVVVYKK